MRDAEEKNKRLALVKEKTVLAWKIVSRSRMIKVLLIVFFLNLVWAAIYSYLEDVPFYLALYWATDTLTNTGSGLVPPSRVITWILTTGLMWIGLGVTLVFVEYVYLKIMKNEKIEVKFKNHIIILGWNQKMRHFLNHLSGLGVHHNYVIVADLNERPYDLPDVVVFVQGDPCEEKTLKSAGVENAQQALIVMDDDSEAILITMTIQGLNPELKLCVNLINGENVKHLQRLEVEEIVCDEYLTGNALVDSFYENQKLEDRD